MKEERQMSKDLIRENEKIKPFPYNTPINGNRLDKMEFPKHIWITHEEQSGKMQYIINYYIEPHFDCPNLKYPDYWIPYENEFDTAEKLLHQLAHMGGKKWFTTEMANEVMQAAQQLHKKINGHDLFWWRYGEEYKIYNKEEVESYE
tara:strand:- start:337 stop:777 length:441 start_codon:yes stop_codon:yes gene_type:complete